MSPKGFLLVTMQPPPAFEEEFNAWYDSEHIPERLAVPGILTARRYVAADAHPKYLAMYDLESHAVMASPAYLKVAFENSSPWTKRVTARVSPWRATGEQIWPGDRLTSGGSAVLLMRLRGLGRGDDAAVIEGCRKLFEPRASTRVLRVLAHDAGATGYAYLAFVEQRMPDAATLDLAPLGALADRVDLVNLYRPY